ncbi:hypothetical protein [Gloeobacter morelensis]|uniref:Uncharacterized protein n=1 Tax=Gloeobacter morelensis MG652769 TaxID=2781736 RepID=A0ABY3PGW2_9CYAN|nr:hypothetical protein [Gloeobacter morelensis]UFP92895.1 hypothetical protein ISF26_13795 [Gloeobacter morelensis MG652769]
MLQRIKLLPWPEIAWSVVLADLGLLVICPLLVVVFFATPGPLRTTLVGVGVPLLCGVAGGVLARVIFSRLFSQQTIDNGIGWALVLTVSLTAFPVGWALGTALQNLPALLGLSAEAGEAVQFVGEFIGNTARLLFDIVFVVGGAMGMFWRAIRVGR